MRHRHPVLAFLAACLLALASLGASAQALKDLDRLERSLRLNPEQKAQFDVARAATQRALVSSAMSAMEFQQVVRAELAKPKPDFATVFRAHDALVDQNRPLFREARDEWAKLYELLDPQQVKVARAYIEDRLKVFEGLGETLAEAMRGFLSR